MENAIVIIALVLIVGGAVLYIYRAKKRGQKCIGCPDSKSGGCNGNCSCCSHGCCNVGNEEDK